MLRKAGGRVSHMWVDQFDVWWSGVLDGWDGHLALDNGPYWVYKRGATFRVGVYRLMISQLVRQRAFDFFVSLDVIIDPKRSRWNWVELVERGYQAMPV